MGGGGGAAGFVEDLVVPAARWACLVMAAAEHGRWQRRCSVWIPGRRPWRVAAGEARASRGGMAWCSPCPRRICDGDLLWIGSDQRRRRACGILLGGFRGLARRGGSPPPRLQWWHTQAVAGAPGIPRWHCCCGWSPDLGGWIWGFEGGRDGAQVVGWISWDGSG